jgi:hypothetical protein
MAARISALGRVTVSERRSMIADISRNPFLEAFLGPKSCENDQKNGLETASKRAENAAESIISMLERRFWSTLECFLVCVFDQNSTT